MRVRYEPEALDEVDTAVAYFEARSVEAAGNFAAELDATVKRIISQPHAWPPLKCGPRRCLLSRFPDQLICRVEADAIRIFAVAYQSRRPGYWRKRTKR